MTRRKYRTQEPPFSVTMELSRGCNLSCSFCAMSAIQDKPGRGMNFMEKSTITEVCRQVRDLGWNCRMGFAMRGDPCMHPDYVGMVRIVREYRPKAHIGLLTNGGGLMRSPGPVENVKALFDAGLNMLGLDDYEGVKYVAKIQAALSEHGRLISGRNHSLGFKYYKYPQDLKGNPQIRRPRHKVLVVIRDIALQSSEKKIGNHGKLFNWAGLGFAPDNSMMGKRCHQPFRQIAVHWDGNVPLCCNTWDSPYQIGNVNTHNLADLWQSNQFGAAREKLYRGERDFAPCKGCNHRSYRVGLLPDLLGKGKLHRPDEQTAADIEEALSHGSRDKIIRLPWKDREQPK